MRPARALTASRAVGAATALAASAATLLLVLLSARPPSVQAFTATTRQKLVTYHREGYQRYRAVSSRQKTSSPTQRRTPMTCELELLQRRTLRRLAPQYPTVDTWIAACLGGHAQVGRRSRVVDSIGFCLVTWFLAYFASRTLLIAYSTSAVLAWRASTLIVCLRAVLVPLVEMYNRSSELWGDRQTRHRMKGALFTGRVAQTGFAMASEASDHRTHFQMLVEDEEGRELLFDVPQVPEYRRVRLGMRCQVVVLSQSRSFSELTGVTEAYLPDLGVFVGRHSLLDKRAFWKLLEARDERQERELEARKSNSRRLEPSGRLRKPMDRRRSVERSPNRGGGSHGGAGGGREHQELRSPQSTRRRASDSARAGAAIIGDW